MVPENYYWQFAIKELAFVICIFTNQFLPLVNNRI